MVKHIILWTLKDDIEHKDIVKYAAQEHLEGLKGKIDGLLDIKVNINPLPSSNCDMMLDTTFESVDALEGYQKNPNHIAVANSYVRPFTASRVCIDYEI